MKLKVFPSDKGDCLLLQTGGKRMLIDGGMRGSYRRHVASALDELRKDGEKLDLVYVSHIDQDHIAGVLRMMEDLVDWRVYDFHRTSPQGNRAWRKPRSKRPPEIGGIWHNAFHQLAGDNDGDIADMLAAKLHVLSGATSGSSELGDLFDLYDNLASSMGEAVELSRRVGPDQLNIPLNKEFGGKLALRRQNQQPIPFGNAKLYVIGPSPTDLENLRSEWNDWLETEKGRKRIRKIAKEHADDERFLGHSEVEELRALRHALALDLGARSNLTEANLASLMLFVEEGDTSLVLTGDGHCDDVMTGMEACGQLPRGGGRHVTVLKVPHHGSKNNTTEAFCKRLTADHYVFCGNGAHHNPHLKIIDRYANSRIGPASKRSGNPETGKPCTFWFNTSSSYRHGRDDHKAHMKKIEEKMRQISRRSEGRIKAEFLKGDSFTI